MNGVRETVLKAIGGWLLLDGIGSIIMYYNKAGYDGRVQSWKKDHWMRVVRAAMGVALILRREE